MTVERAAGFSPIPVSSPKMTREALCLAQAALSDRIRAGLDVDRSHRAADRIQSIIDQIDVIRPLGPDGKHGNRHTSDCGCEDK